MNSDDLALFATVARLRNISRAALELGLDQSTITRHIGKLEQEIGVRLFYRSGRGAVPTDAGNAFLQSAQKVLDTLEHARRAAHALSHAGPARMVIAAPPTIGGVLFGPLAIALGEAFPATALRFVEGLGSHILKLLAEGEVDIGIVYAPVPAALARHSLMLEEAIYLVGPGTAPPLGEAFESRHIRDLPLVLPSTPYGVRMMAESLARSLGLSLNIRVECDTGTATMKRLVEAGLGYSLMPLAVLREEIAAGRLQAARFTDPPLKRDIIVATARNRDTAVGLWRVLQLLQGEIEQLVHTGDWPGVTLLARPG
jgi:LysR family nitrogen assimilation transcriptional regulator